MSLSSTHTQLADFHRKYVVCAAKKMTQFLQDNSKPADSENPAPSNTKIQEFCVEEKKAYFEYMAKNFKTEYENILRLEQNNF